MESSMTSTGQITIPASIRKKLGLKPHDRIRFEVVGDDVFLRPPQSVVDRYFGALNGRLEPDDTKRRELFEQAVADEAWHEGME